MIGFIFLLYFVSVIICTIGWFNEGNMYSNNREEKEECKMKFITILVPVANIILAVWYLRRWLMITIKAVITTIKNLSW